MGRGLQRERGGYVRFLGEAHMMEIKFYGILIMGKKRTYNTMSPIRLEIDFLLGCDPLHRPGIFPLSIPDRHH